MENGYGDGFTGYTPAHLVPAPPRPDAAQVTWRWWEAVIVFLVGSVLGAVLAIPGLAAVKSDNLQQLIAGMAGEIGLGVGVVGWLWLMHRRNIRALGFPERPLREIGAGVVGGLAVYAAGVFVVASVLTTIIQHTQSRHVRAPRQLPTHLGSGELIMAGITVIVLAPICEELFFRGMLFKSLRARHGFWFAGPISAVCFGAAHYQGQWQNGLLLALTMVFVGLGLAFIYERRGNIVANMAAHATFNIIGFIFIVTLNH